MGYLVNHKNTIHQGLHCNIKEGDDNVELLIILGTTLKTVVLGNSITIGKDTFPKSVEIIRR